MLRRAFALPLVLLCPYAALGCTSHVRDALRRLEQPGHAVVATTAGPNASMIYLARVDSGVIVIDLGWVGAERALRAGVRRLGGPPDRIVAVFLTHSHRDHLGAWRAVAHAPFYVSAAEVARLEGRVGHAGWIPRLAEQVQPTRGPRPGAVAIRAFSRDTAFAIGNDTVHAFLVPGHTAGSAAYLFRGVLFAGDAISHTARGRLRSARAGYSDDATAARRSLTRLWSTLESYDVRFVCTAHARCAAYTPELRRELSAP
ncbi:MAG: MBL fold metallo-hydrolase [Gemmatimonadaceae bacterium]